MANNVVAYVGVDNFDIILYVSRILIKLGRKVLVVDHSETNSIKYSIPKPEGVDVTMDVITFRHVEVTLMEVSKELAEQFDDILIAYGFNWPENDIKLCNKIIYVTDMYRYNLKRLNLLSYEEVMLSSVEKRLLIRSVMDTMLDISYFTHEINKQIERDNISYLYQNEQDDSNALLCHTNQVVRFHKITKQLKMYLLKEIRLMYPDITKKQLKDAYRKARRGA